MAPPSPPARRRRRLAASLGVLAVLLVPVLGARGANIHANYHAVCPGPPAGSAHCHVLVTTDEHGNPAATSAPTGLSPDLVKAAYGFPTSSAAGAGQTVAIVDAYDDPTAEADLATFSSQFGLPACTTGNGCFQKVDQSGGTSYPRADGGWALEISLDVQWAHAIAPGAKVLLVEAASNSFSDLLTAEGYAKTHAAYVSNSWGAPEFSLEQLYDSSFAQSGVSVFVSAGDNGLPAEYPSSSPNVISVGGTTLHFDSGGNVTGETGWSGGGGGCSAYETATSAQSAFSGYAQVKCGGRRATPDVALDADPASGVSVYDSTSYGGQTGWFQVGGTSASSPMWAARSAVAGAVVTSAYVYGSSITYRDITSGSNGAPCLTGYDLCSGRGSWVSAPTSGSLSLSGGSASLTAGQPSPAMHVDLPAAQGSDVVVSLSTTSSGGTFSLTPGGAATSTVTVAASQTSSPAFYYTDTRAGGATLTAHAGGFADATRAETVAAGSLASIVLTPSSATLTAGGTQGFTATGKDAYQNPVGLSGTTWSSDLGGSFSSQTASSATYTAPSAPASGSVSATSGSVVGKASVTVVELAAPTGLSASSPRKRRINLSWHGVAGATGYRVYRNGTRIASVGGTSYTDTGVTSGVTYSYDVTAVSGSAESPPSNTVTQRAR